MQDHVHLGFEYLRGWRHYSLFGKPVPVFDYHHSKTVFLVVEWKFLEFMIINSCPVTGCD